MSTDLKRLEDTPIEALAILANEEAENAAKQWQQAKAMAKSAIRSGQIAGKCLSIIKQQLPHGQWLPWLEENWQHHRSWAARLMKLSNVECTLHLEDATSLSHALRLMDEAEEAAGAKRSRKAAAVPAPEVEVIDNRPAKPQEQPQTPPAMFDDSDDLPPEEPPALPKTNTLHTPATQQRIDRGPEPAPPQPVEDAYGMPLLEVVIGNHTTQEVVDALIVGLQGTQAKRVAAILREAAEKLDPQPVIHDMTEKPAAKAKKHPTADQLMEATRDYPVKWTSQLITQVHAWAEYKQSLAGNAKVRSLTSWAAMLARIDNVQKMRGPGTVCEMINKAIANGWQGWEHDSSSNGKPTVASTRIDSGEDYSDLEYRTA
jgi:hypothetical protein